MTDSEDRVMKQWIEFRKYSHPTMIKKMAEKLNKSPKSVEKIFKKAVAKILREYLQVTEGSPTFPSYRKKT